MWRSLKNILESSVLGVNKQSGGDGDKVIYVSGGSPLYRTDDYNYRINGGAPSMSENDYVDGILRGGSPMMNKADY